MKRGDERFKTGKTERDSIKGKGNDTRIKLLNCGMYIMYINVYKQSLNLFKPSVILYNIPSQHGEAGQHGYEVLRRFNIGPTQLGGY